jgi:twitching motility protein PilT
MSEMASTPQPLEEPVHAPPVEGGPKLARFFLAMTKLGASDLHVRPGSVPHLRINTAMRPTKSEPIPPAEIEAMAMELMTAKQKAQLAECGSVDVAYEQPGGDRYRINIYHQRGLVALAVRRVTRIIPDFQALHLPVVLEKIADNHQGLVLVSGPTGSGKSTTIAAMLEYINRKRPCHIVTIEDPIEFLYEEKKALISQREIGIDVENFEQALKYLMREDPDVVLIGEMRDHDTFQAALQASETGHLVFGTVHASGAAQTFGRVLDLFPHESRELVRQSLAFNLRAIICQKLLPSIGEGVYRIPAVEIMVSNPSIRQLILESRDNEMPEVLRTCEQDGMRAFNRSLQELIEKGLVDPRVAYENAPNPEELKMLMKGISASRGGVLGR